VFEVVYPEYRPIVSCGGIAQVFLDIAASKQLHLSDINYYSSSCWKMIDDTLLSSRPEIRQNNDIKISYEANKQAEQRRLIQIAFQKHA
jgi:hypothetical protein